MHKIFYSPIQQKSTLDNEFICDIFMGTAFYAGVFWAKCTNSFSSGSFGKLYDLDLSKLVKLTAFFL